MIAVGSDHGGYDLKKEVCRHLSVLGIDYRDFGTHSSESCDYPVFAEAVGHAVASGEYGPGILICGTGIGISIAANKIKGIRAALCNDCYSAEMARRHNDANILVLGGRVVGSGHALKITELFLKTPFEGERHSRRLELITALEQGSPEAGHSIWPAHPDISKR